MVVTWGVYWLCWHPFWPQTGRIFWLLLLYACLAPLNNNQECCSWNVTFRVYSFDLQTHSFGKSYEVENAMGLNVSYSWIWLAFTNHLLGSLLLWLSVWLRVLSLARVTVLNRLLVLCGVRDIGTTSNNPLSSVKWVDIQGFLNVGSCVLMSGNSPSSWWAGQAPTSPLWMLFVPGMRLTFAFVFHHDYPLSVIVTALRRPEVNRLPKPCERDMPFNRFREL